MYKYAIITLSDKGAKGQREDKSRKEIEKIITGELDYELEYYTIIPDERKILKREFEKCESNKEINLVITTGGTGFSSRDITPDVTKEFIEKEVPGMAEQMRLKSCEITPHGMLSRAVTGIKNNTLIINLPGSPKGARENLSFIKEAIPHGLGILTGKEGECGKD
ncbi:MAG: MogA/MoaB family molybdenum cofactor biosynthesis protein [Candidatus Mcinerneyibacterium aminivorans]|uniref:MogA/MoaB family molybdenum cofactor biosynthesis protein n=1 Tax=Candidatus Mcinerneyibacterium aminivorans TaxID=2703815 RepID=A0A5D0MIT2_9BACT|nr:MAG: MogA/MoaB family molybdenum cofactor biosynthesis protein [Candidatus Mcinerneyibacterium aminivorans]